MINNSWLLLSTGVGKTRNETKRNETGSGNQTTPKRTNNPLAERQVRTTEVCSY